MPELPEVESVVRSLNELIVGRTIVHAELTLPRLAPNNHPQQFTTLLKRARISNVVRRGKHIIVHLVNQKTLITHLRMTGKFLYLDKSVPNTKHTHAFFQFDNDRKLLFDDQRQFGFMEIVDTNNLDQLKYLKLLAPEPFSEEFTAEYLFQTLKRYKQVIKNLLLDQTKVLGLGNIYAAEALHRARINPKLPSDKISRPRVVTLHKEIIEVLNEAIARNVKFDPTTGDLNSSYGKLEAIARVYERAGAPCFNCGSIIQRIVQNNRSTYYCPVCQRR